jgi:hypothetical protein
MWMVVWGFVAGATSTASSGPDLVERATVVDLPVQDVVVFSDRARVTRRGPVRLPGGVVVVRAPDLPGATLPGSVRVTSTGATVVRVETEPVERERWGLDQVDAWIATLEELQDKIALVAGRLQAARNELALLANLTAAPPVPEKDRLGKPLVPAADAWREAQDRLAKRRVAARATEHALEAEDRALRLELGRVQREVQARDIGGFTEQRLQVLVILEGDRGDGTVDVEYAVPGASWKPAYDLLFDPDKGTVSLAAAGLVTQASGEDWPQVHLGLSTSIPGEGLVLPHLRTWTLGDDREFVPRPSARTTPRTVQPFAPPTPRPRAPEVERAADRELLQQRVEHLLVLAQMGAGQGRGLGLRGTGAGGGGAAPTNSIGTLGTEGWSGARAERDDKDRVPPPPPPPMPMPSAPMPSMAPAAAPESYAEEGALYDDAEDEVAPKAASREARKKSAPRPSLPAAGLRLSSATAWQRPTFDDPLLPAVSAAGFDVVYNAPLPATVPSDASGLKVPLAVRAYDVSTFYEATPSLATTAYLKATVKNGATVPILAGPANVFVKGAFAGDAMLATTGPGGALELPLGADEDIRLTRTVIPSTRRQGFVVGEEDVTDYAVKIEVGNYKKRAITIRVIDQIPKTNAEKLRVELVTTSPKPETPPDGDGLLHWHVDIPAGATKTITFTYRIARPKDWRLAQ